MWMPGATQSLRQESQLLSVQDQVCALWPLPVLPASPRAPLPGQKQRLCRQEVVTSLWLTSTSERAAVQGGQFSGFFHQSISEGVGGTPPGTWVPITVRGHIQHSDDGRFCFQELSRILGLETDQAGRGDVVLDLSPLLFQGPF